ncbi:MAG: nitroreductase family protein [Alphaproteobacteria bacterium]
METSAWQTAATASFGLTLWPETNFSGGKRGCFAAAIGLFQWEFFFTAPFRSNAVGVCVGSTLFAWVSNSKNLGDLQMEVGEAIYQRRAVRSYARKAVTQTLTERLIDAAIQAPSAMNTQPWHFTVIRSAELLDLISAASKAHMLKAVEQGELPAQLRDHLANPEFHIFYHAPTLILISAKRAAWAAEDAALAAQNLMLAACAEGLGSCWIGFAQRWLETTEGRQVIDLGADYVPVAPIIVGHPDVTPQPVPRKRPMIKWLG